MTLRVPDAQRPTGLEGGAAARVRAAVHGVPGRGGLFRRRRGREEAPAGETPSPQDGAFFPPADTTPPAAADERDAARSALRRLQEMDRVIRPRDAAHGRARHCVKPRARRVELVPTRPAGAPMPPPPPPPPGPPPPGPPPDTTTLLSRTDAR